VLDIIEGNWRTRDHSFASCRGELERLADREGEWQMEKHSGPGKPLAAGD